jgi:hypothetical protein
MIIYGNATLIVDTRLRATGCLSEAYFVTYDIGAKVYLVTSAKHGKLEHVFIKKYIINFPYNQFNVMYKDAFNCVWAESELCDNQTATNYALAYWRQVAEDSGIVP